VSFIFQHACCLVLLVFSCICVSQGSVATLLRCGEIFNNHYIANCPKSVPVKNFKSRLIFVKDMNSYEVERFFF